MEIKHSLLLCIIILFAACTSSKTAQNNSSSDKSSIKKSSAPNKPVAYIINTRDISANDVVTFAETLKGVKYKYGSVIKENGFDCSGFINYVFNNFGIPVPRTSVSFTNTGTEVPVTQSKRGDLILFTGTDTTGWTVGHMGIITKNQQGKVSFIHSSSGKNIGVIVSEMSSYYKTRLVKVIRIFKNFS